MSRFCSSRHCLRAREGDGRAKEKALASLREPLLFLDEDKLVLPARLRKAWDESLVSHFTEGDTADHELSVDSTRTSGQLATVADTLLSTVTRQRLKLHASLKTLLIGELRIDSLSAKLSTDWGLVLSHLDALVVAKY